jgi:phage tail protein X
MTEFYSYITKDNDRWDSIAYKFYQDATKYEVIIQANPSVPITPTLESGIKLKIPVLDANNEITFELPPWRS